MAFADKGLMKGIALLAFPLLLIGAARLATFSDWAAQNAAIAAVIYAWIAIDALALAAIAKAPRLRPGIRAMLGAVAAGSAIALLGAADPVRDAILAMPPLLGALLGTILIYCGWSGALALRKWHETRSAEAAIGEIISPRLAHFVLSELRMLRIGLLSWGAKREIPAGSLGFAYHRYLTPMLATFLALQLIELAIVHLFVSLWNETVAWVLLALSVWGAIWLLALMKSFRLYPVLLGETDLRVRSGTIVDCRVPLHAIEHIDAAFSADCPKAGTTLNLALLSSPNICLALSEPVEYRTFLGAVRQVDRIGLRLDDSAAFIAALERRLPRKARR